MQEALLELQSVNHHYKIGHSSTHVLKNVGITIHKGTFNVIYGASGSGKSTLLNILTGLQSPTEGSVRYEGDDIYKNSADSLAQFRANKIGIVYQQSYWIQSLNVLDNISMPLYFTGRSRKEAREIALRTLDSLGMIAYATKDPTLLSGGEQQRVNMARALVHSPMTIIADEPTGNLDSTNSDMVMDMLHQASVRDGRTVVLVTHNMKYLPLANHIFNITDGTVTELNSQAGVDLTRSMIDDLVKIMHGMTGVADSQQRTTE